MPKSTATSFITEIPLKLQSVQEKRLNTSFQFAKQVFNACLGEALRRITKIKNDSRYSEAMVLYKSSKKTEGQHLFKELRKDYGFSEYALHTYAKQWSKTDFSKHLGSHIIQKLSTRAFNSANEYFTGKKGKPRFKGFRGLNSIENKKNGANMTWKDGVLTFNRKVYPPIIDADDLVIKHGLSKKIKYTRIVRRQLNGKTRFFVQLICEGMPYQKAKNTIGKSTVGIDIGPSTIAIVSADTKEVSLNQFCDQIESIQKQKTRLQKQINRQIRANNPEAFEADRWVRKDKNWTRKQGPNIRGKSCRNKSKALVQNQNKLAELERVLAAHRKSLHGKMVNDILRIGNNIKTENISLKAFQKMWGKSIGFRAPGMFLSMLESKAVRAGGKMDRFSTYHTKLSQTCHCGNVKKKALSERIHQCKCGVEAQRDLYSAYLACYVENNALIASDAVKHWKGMEVCLQSAIDEIKHSSSGLLPASFGFQRQRMSTKKSIEIPSEASLLLQS